jgi:hypothetical protein
LHWLAGDLRDQLVITVEVQDGDPYRGCHPLIASVAVSSYLIELRPAQRRQDSCHFRMVQAGERAGAKPSTVDQIPIVNSLVSTTRYAALN